MKLYILIRFFGRVNGWISRNLFSKILRFIYSDSGVSIDQGAIFYGFPIIECVNGAMISIGKNSVLCSKSYFTALGVSHPVIIRAQSRDASIIIGNDCGMSGTTICSIASIEVGDGVLFGADVQIFDNDFHPIISKSRRYDMEKIKSKPVKIGSNVFIGSRTTVLKGVNIGVNSVIGAGSVVLSDIPDNCIAAGNPCRVIRSL
ncbi:2,3,4,5-tetrahydropyridine-2,6-dicarboxylate N-acetyltransferase [Comamonadaceae bacterium OS-1]|nr:2,3,4,5-tetrahydropyridine-2,6-dicarboxylate N-acetyltransferase [Comamonadaceae bacterium OS-1]